VLFLVYPFTDDDFGMAMIEEAEPGVLASGVPEKSQARSNTGWDPASTHNKVIIIDERVVVRGLYNFSQSAKTRNDENTLLIPDPEIAVLYMEEFKRVWLEAQDQSQ
jgi:phosphatidylserine/phosphatidylglycerophosphate/cardiolipin synthase-like enzyme